MKSVVTWALAWQESAWTEMGFGPRPLRRRLLPLTTPRAARGCSLGAWVLFVRLHSPHPQRAGETGETSECLLTRA